MGTTTIADTSSSEPCRLAFVVNQLMDTGPIFVIREIIRHLPANAYQVYIIELCKGSEEVRQEYLNEVFHIQSLGFSKWALEFRTRKVAQKVNDYLCQEKISIVHSHTYHPDLVISLLPISASYHRVTTLHNLSKEDFRMKKGIMLGRYMHLRLRCALKRIPHIVGISQWVTQYYAPHTPKQTFHYTIYNGVDTERFLPISSQEKRQLRARLGWSESEKVLVMVGRLSRGKDPLLVLRSVNYLLSCGALKDSFRLCLVGDGPLKKKCQRRCKKNRSLADHVRLVGFSKEVENYVRASDAAISASQSEGFGLNVIESIVSGLPTATTDIPVFEELLRYAPSIKKIQFRRRNMKECAQAIQNSCNFVIPEEELLRVREMFASQQVGANYHKLYSKLLRNS